MVVAILAGAAASPPDAPGWVQGAAATGADAIGVAATGVVAIGMGETGAVVTGTAIGVIITVTIMSSLLAASAFHRGGAGDLHITATGIRTAITDMVIHTVTVMATAGMDMVTTAIVTDLATALAANTALPLGLE
jgi:hypothetical protein